MRPPPKLKPGDEIRVRTWSRSWGGVRQWNGTTEQDIAYATARLEAMGLKVSFGKHVRAGNEHLTASPAQRLEDLHAAIAEPSVKAILAVSGGAGAIQILDGIDYDLVAAHPKIICGNSDISFPGQAILATPRPWPRCPMADAARFVRTKSNATFPSRNINPEAVHPGTGAPRYQSVSL